MITVDGPNSVGHDGEIDVCVLCCDDGGAFEGGLKH